MAGVVNTIIVIPFGAWLPRHPESTLLKAPLTPGNLAAYFLYMNMLLWPIRMIFELFSATLRAASAAERVFGILGREPAIQDREGAIEPEQIRGDIQFERVRFQYGEKSPWILTDFDLTIKAAETVALIVKSYWLIVNSFLCNWIRVFA